jgi:hypothetical protein
MDKLFNWWKFKKRSWRISCSQLVGSSLCMYIDGQEGRDSVEFVFSSFNGIRRCVSMQEGKFWRGRLLFFVGVDLWCNWRQSVRENDKWRWEESKRKDDFLIFEGASSIIFCFVSGMFYCFLIVFTQIKTTV